MLFHIEAWTWTKGKLAWAQVKCTWLQPTYVNKVLCTRIKNIYFTSAKKLKENRCQNRLLEQKQPRRCIFKWKSSRNKASRVLSPSPVKIIFLFKKWNNCKIKPVALSLSNDYADQFIAKSRSMPVVSDLFDPEKLDLEWQELLQKCPWVEQVEKGSGLEPLWVGLLSTVILHNLHSHW